MSTISASTTSTTAFKVTSDTTGTLVLQTGSTPTTAVTIDASQNVGVGTASPLGLLDVVSSSTTLARVRSTTGTTAGSMYQNSASGTTSTDGFFVGIDGSLQGYLYNYENGPLLFGTNNAERARVDSSGNLGLNATPSSWASGWRTLQVGGSVSVFNGSSGLLALASNGYWDGTNYRYQSTNYAGQLDFNIAAAGGWVWRIAASGTAGNTITWNSAMTLDSNGSLLVGTTDNSGTPRFKVLQATGNRICRIESVDAGTVEAFQFVKSSGGLAQVGSISMTTTATAYNTSSDYRLKEDVQPMVGALAKVAQLKPVTYKWKSDGSSSEGFIAHELAEVVPDAVTGEKDATQIEQYEISPAVPATFDAEGNEMTPAVEAVRGEREVPVYQGIDTSFLVATLTAAIQEQQAIIETLTNRITALEAK